MIRRPLEDQARRRAVFQAGVVYRCRPGSGGSQHRPLLGSRRHQKTEFNDLDWTVGVKLGHDRSGCYWLLDMVRARANPGDIERLLAQYCRAGRKNVRIGFGKDPGLAGKIEALHPCAHSAASR